MASSALPSIYYLASNAYLYDSGTWQAGPTHTGFATWQAGCKTLSAKLRALSGWLFSTWQAVYRTGPARNFCTGSLGTPPKPRDHTSCELRVFTLPQKPLFLKNDYRTSMSIFIFAICLIAYRKVFSFLIYFEILKNYVFYAILSTLFCESLEGDHGLIDCKRSRRTVENHGAYGNHILRNWKNPRSIQKGKPLAYPGRCSQTR